jgi:hypothetical protein
MSIQVKCTRCGTTNELNRVFCLKCGDKLDLARAITGGKRRRAGRFISGPVRIAVVLLILSIVGLILWPVEPRGAFGSAADARTMNGILRWFYQAVQNRAVVGQFVTEKEVNGYLAQKLKQNGDAFRSEGFRLGIRQINVAFTPENFVVLVLANWGPVSLSYEVKAVPSVKSGRFEVKAQEARWGHLPLPRPAAGWMNRRVAGMFLRMENELAVLNGLGRVDLKNGRAYIATRGL